MIAKVRATRHNGRANKNGVFTTKHNDRNFDISSADHIDEERTSRNVYWDWQNGMRTGEQSVYECNDGSIASFEEAEKAFYEQRYGDYVEKQNARNVEYRHPERNRTVDDLRHDKRYCPEESIYQFGKDGEGATAEQLIAIFQEYKENFDMMYGSHIHILDWAMHADETTVHIQERHCFDFKNSHGEIEPKQEQALKALGIQLPYPDKPAGRYNSRKMTFDAENRQLLIDIAKEHGLEINEEVKYGGKKHQEKMDMIIESQQEKIVEQDTMISDQQAMMSEQNGVIEAQKETLEAQMIQIQSQQQLIEDQASRLDECDHLLVSKELEIEAKNRQLKEKDTLIEEKDIRIKSMELRLEDVEKLTNDLANEAYSKTVDTLSEIVVKETMGTVFHQIDRYKQKTGDPKLKIKKHSRRQSCPGWMRFGRSWKNVWQIQS